jgi:hypothetical protein
VNVGDEKIELAGYPLRATPYHPLCIPIQEKVQPAPLEKEESRRSCHGEDLILTGLFLPPEKTLNEFLIGPEP